mmetsp:Transcript_24201/g.27698  ORF Transcript_24201/g.27698 Transcript_24201/m.27698 type:complete len:103 (-) Transcript_24201:660-968(-)
MHLPFFFLKQGSLNATLHGTTGGRSQKQSSPSQQSLRHRPPLTQSLTHSPPLFVHSSDGGQVSVGDADGDAVGDVDRDVDGAGITGQSPSLMQMLSYANLSF